MISPGDIQVQADSRFLSAESAPDNKRYAFAYTITITNEGQEPVQLMNRYWKITDGYGNEREVRGKGVVGQQPVIPAGTSFRYTSGAILETAVGFMTGHYEVTTSSGEVVTVPIPEFSLEYQQSLH